MNRTHRHTVARGHSLIEVTLGVAVLSVGLMISLGVASGGRSFVAQAQARVESQNGSRAFLAGMSGLLLETKLAFVDTSYRVYVSEEFSGGDEVVFTSDRFYVDGTAQCVSPTCRFHTTEGLGTRMPQYYCGHAYGSGSANVTLVRGRVWPREMRSCPLDGSPLSTPAFLDGVKFFSARSETGEFQTDESGPVWNGLVLLFPFVNEAGKTELRRYDVHLSDLQSGYTDFTPGFSAFSPGAPSMVQLFDFGTDGTRDGVPDGSVPTTSESSDADYDVFVSTTYYGEPAVYLTKILNSYGDFPYRMTHLIIRLRDGFTQFYVSHWENSTSFWYGSSEFTRQAQTVVSQLSDLAISTAISNPYDAETNPTGVQNQDLIRLTLVTTKEIREKGELRCIDHLEHFEIAPRN